MTHLNQAKKIQIQYSRRSPEIQRMTLRTRVSSDKWDVIQRELHSNWKSPNSFDFQGVFLHAPLSEEIFIKNPKGVNRQAPYLKLKKYLYGLNQSPKNWYKTLTVWLNLIGFSESNCDPFLYI
ncbi:reverse transcriptase-like protein [Puccinia sorghi]|uniref:Reverse transcriptase-like protein n=1 Tax=Puccinia sorghi TaxID=27349 RepID=A0A0L6V1E0_9BASI|nr:reverse transcriptase-like protein [Puccinia sorghi]